jgi:hypothetical protein
VNDENRRSQKNLARVLLLVITVLISFSLPGSCRSAGEVLSDYSRLSDKERGVKILEGTKREGKLVYFGTTAVDHIQRVFAEFFDPEPGEVFGITKAGLVTFRRTGKASTPNLCINKGTGHLLTPDRGFGLQHGKSQKGRGAEELR